MPTMVQFAKGEGKRLQRWDRLTEEQQDAVLALLDSKKLTKAQKDLLAELGDVRRLYVVDDVDGEYIAEDVTTGVVHKRGKPHDVPARAKLRKVVSGNGSNRKPRIPNVG